MQITILLATICITGVFCGDSSYTSKYDDIDLESILTNERLLRNYVNCLLDKGRCTKDAAELKKHIPEALETQCSKCSETHRNGIRKAIKYISENHKDMWKELVQKYDPDGVYRRKYEELLKEEKITVF